MSQKNPEYMLKTHSHEAAVKFDLPVTDKLYHIMY
jgi:hypothetical protein